MGKKPAKCHSTLSQRFLVDTPKSTCTKEFTKKAACLSSN